MTDLPEKPVAADMEGPGAQLRRARERRGLLLHDVAQELHLDEWMLQALEEDDFAALGAPVFTKGHMRKYGDMLGLNSDDLMIAYYRKRGRDDSPPPITQMIVPEASTRPLQVKGIGRLLLVLVVIALVGFLAWLFLRDAGGPETPEPAAVSSSQPDMETSVPVRVEMREQVPLEMTPELPGVTVVDAPGQGSQSTEDVATQPAGTAASSQAGETPGQADDVAQVAVPAAAVGADSGLDAATPERIGLRLILSGESWVEVTDSEGDRLIYAMMRAGRIRAVSGTPPIEVFLGLSRAVQLEVNGQPYPIPRSAIRGNTARFVIDVDSL